MDTRDAKERLEKEWDLEKGFLGQLRLGRFSQEGVVRLLNIFEELPVSGEEYLDRRFVSLSWYIPVFMTWQISRLDDLQDKRSLETAMNRVVSALERVLGVP